MTPASSAHSPTNASDTRPRIVLCASDHSRLTALAESHAHSAAADYLSEELTRAHVVPDDECDEQVVRMGSHAAYRDEITGQTRDISLVYPHEADIASNRISILTPIGAALIGLHADQMTLGVRFGSTQSIFGIPAASGMLAGGHGQLRARGLANLATIGHLPGHLL